MIVEINSIDQTSWHKNLQLFNDANIYQTWEFGASLYGEKNLSHLVLKVEGEVLGLAQVRIVRVPLLRTGIAYLRYGPIFHREKSELNGAIFRQIINALRAEYVTKQGYALRVVPSAFIGSARAEVCKNFFLEAGFEERGQGAGYRTILVDIRPSLEDIRKALAQKWRNQLNQAERKGLVVSEGTDSESWDVFSELYCEMMRRKNFDTTVDIKDYALVQDMLPEELKLKIFIARSEGKPVAGVVCSFIGDTGVYLLGATNLTALKLRAANLLQWEVIESMKKNGLSFYDLGGINPDANPGGYHFKSGVAGRDVTQLATYEFCDSLRSCFLLRASSIAVRFLRFFKKYRNKKVD